MADTPCSLGSLSTRCQENKGFPTFERLPSEIKKRIASLLPPVDAVALSQTCRTVHSVLTLSDIHLPSAFPGAMQWIGGHLHDWLKRGPRLPSLLFSHAHSVTLTCTYRDQGWGNRKGYLYIVGHRLKVPGGSEDEYACDPNDFSQGRIVAESPLAEHHDVHLRMSFCPREDEAYHLWYIVGGGGGHKLIVSNAKQTVVVYDNPSRGMRKAFQYLSPLLDLGNEDEGAVSRRKSTVEIFLPLLTATLQTLTKMKEACKEGDLSLSMFESTHEPILAHLREHDLNVMSDETLHTLQDMIRRVNLAATKILSHDTKEENGSDDWDDESDSLFNSDEDMENYLEYTTGAGWIEE